MLLYDLSHTSHSQARTGVQRVALELRKAMREITPIAETTYDPYRQTWRKLAGWERQALESSPQQGKRRGAYWPLRAKLGGRLQRLTGSDSDDLVPDSSVSGFLAPEIFTARTGKTLPHLFRQISGPKVAVFHDAISLRRPELTPSGTVGRFPFYLNELRYFDGIVAVSEDSRQSLQDYWRWAEWKDVPPVKTISLGLDHLHRTTKPVRITAEPPIILSVGSVEGRKNHLKLIEACERLWRDGKNFELRIIGSLQRQTGAATAERMDVLKTQGRPLHYHGWLSDAELQSQYTDCAFTVYPSLLEGFGLPVWESLLQGRPCICSSSGATAETAAGGGCLAIDTSSVDEISRAIAILLDDKEKLTELSQAAASRVPPTWRQCADQILDWIRQLPLRSSK
ncbi:MAG: hypothetical protein SynsKO_37470 [Synoicihabitans sp.]